ncbi:transposase [Vibrio splendidus]
MTNLYAKRAQIEEAFRDLKEYRLWDRTSSQQNSLYQAIRYPASYCVAR